MNGIRLTEEEARRRVNERCQELNYTFLGFDNEEDKYTNNKVKLRLKCNKCGSEWNTTAYEKFMTGRNGCPGCNPRRKQDKDYVAGLIKKRCKDLDYTFLGFVGEYKSRGDTKLNLSCNKCGMEWNSTTVENFLKNGRNSHSCGRKNPSEMPSFYNEEKQIEKIKEKLSESTLKFISFDENGYIGVEKTKLVVHCSGCGENITISYHNLIYGIPGGVKCPKCQYNGKVSNDIAIKNIKKKCELLEYEFLGFDNPENRYDGKDTRLVLRCLKCGYVWKTTTYTNFINRVIKCRGCINNWHLERVAETALKENKINYEMQKRFDWLKNKINMTLDFYLPDYDISIECQGRQHFVPVDKFGGKEGFDDTVARDTQKKRLCEEHGIKIVYFTELKKYDTFMGEKLIKTDNDLIRAILNYGR